MTTERISVEALLNDFMAKQLSAANIAVSFPEDIALLRKDELKPAPCRSRLDLRATPCLTIDCDDTKDMDDAVSLERIPGGYELGVHIADVSAFVTPGSRLDEEAANRGSSIYLANQTIPMLPPVLSNELCSLNPNADRLAISILIDLTENGTVLGYKVAKTVIRSRVKGTYSEINALLAGTASARVAAKYSAFTERLHAMRALSEALLEVRRGTGANVTPTEEVRVSVRGDEVRLTVRTQGAAESLIEEFMVLANALIARYFYDNSLPCLYRTQRQRHTLAQYQAAPDLHAELALEHYVHFTSPIRRLSDLRIHQILTDWLDGMSIDALRTKHGGAYLQASADLATKRARRAQALQKLCSDFCYSHYFSRHYRSVYTGRVVGFSRTNQPILRIDEYPVRVLGNAALKAAIGDAYLFNVYANTQTRRLFATKALKLSA